MRYDVKLSSEVMESVKKMIGAESGILNLSAGILHVMDKEAILRVAETTKVEAVNGKPYEDVRDDLQKAPETEQLKDIIGNEPVVGSIVRVKNNGAVEHYAIVKEEDGWYAATFVRLDDDYCFPDSEIPLFKGQDVVYRNFTYKQQVTVVKEVLCGLKKKDFIGGAGGMVVGKIINQEVLDRIIAMTKSDVENDARFALKKRKEAIGDQITVGSIVRVRHDEVEHMVILDVEGEDYTAAKLALADTTGESSDRVPLKKGEDVIYRNMNYKDIVTVEKEISYGLKFSDFIKNSGGMIVGKVVNVDAIKPIIEYAIHPDADTEEAPEAQVNAG